MPLWDRPKLKEAADNTWNVDIKGFQNTDYIENIVEKGDIAHFEQFHLFPQCFPKAFFFNMLKCVYMVEIVNPFPHNNTFWRIWERSLLKTLWEKEKFLVQAISPFPTMFSTLSATEIIIFVTFNLSSANAVNSVWPKILSCENGLKRVYISFKFVRVQKLSFGKGLGDISSCKIHKNAFLSLKRD